jgi:hypothetical protein
LREVVEPLVAAVAEEVFVEVEGEVRVVRLVPSELEEPGFEEPVLRLSSEEGRADEDKLGPQLARNETSNKAKGTRDFFILHTFQ